MGCFGGIFLVAGAWASATGFYHLATGTPLMLSDDNSIQRTASRGEVWAIALFPLIHAVVGLACFLYWSRARVVVRDDGLTATNLFGAESFRAQWSELSRLESEGRSDDGTFYNLHTVDGRKLRLPDRNTEELIDVLHERAPQLRPLTSSSKGPES